MLDNIKLHSSLDVPTTAAAKVTNTSGKKTIVKGFIVHNYTSLTTNFSLHIVYNNEGSLGTVSDSNKMFGLELQSNESVSYTFPYAVVLNETNDAVFVKASAVDSLNIMILGDVITT